MRRSVTVLIIVIVAIGAGFGIYQWWEGKYEKLPESIPDDLEIYYSYSDFQLYFLGKIEGEELTINFDGQVNLLRGHKGFEAEEQFGLTEEELLEIYQEIVKNDFFGLRTSYIDPRVIDGGCALLRIKAGGVEHTVSVTNEDVPQFDRCVETILEIIRCKQTLWSEIEDKICSEAELICRTQDTYQNIPCDYWEENCREKITYFFVGSGGERAPFDPICGTFEENEQINIEIEVINYLHNELPFRIDDITIHDHVKLTEVLSTVGIRERIEVSKVDFCHVTFPKSVQIIEGNSSKTIDVTITCNDVECIKSEYDNLCWFTVIPQIYVNAFGAEKPLEPVIYYHEPTFKLETE